MAQHDKYDMDILKQLTRIANSLERIERTIREPQQVDMESSKLLIGIGEPMYESLKR